MDFYAVLDQVVALLRSRRRVSYRALQLQFQLDDATIEALKDELIHAQHVALDEDDRIMVWTEGAHGTPPSALKSTPSEQGGSHIDHPSAVAIPPAEPRATDAERRQLTVLFCDLVDSTVLASQLDPEEWRDVVRAYQTTCAEVVQRFDGHIAQYLGDGVLVYFGYPLAHEDDAQRGVRAGLGIVEAMAQLNARLEKDKRMQLAVRMGIHTGLVVVGEMGGMGRQEQLALGETPNVAARLQGIAAPNWVVISAATHRLVQGYIGCQDLGLQTLKGVSAPVHVYRVFGESGVQSRLELASTRGLTPLVGRESEVALLLARWAQVKAGMGQVVLLSGEAGIGKSRLVQVLKDRLAGEPYRRLECRCSSYYQHSALYPVIELFQQALQWTREDAPPEKLRKLEGALRGYGVSLSEVGPLLAALLALPLPERYPPLTLTPQRQKQQTLEAVLAVLLALAAQQPVLFIIEDLHWIDPSTLELLGLLIDQAATARIFTVLTYRPEFHPLWGVRSHMTALTLERLSRPQAETIAARVAGGKPLPAEVVRQVAAKTDGVPLFVEELTKMVLESGLVREREESYELTGPLPPLAIPATLHDSLMARLDRLAAVKQVAQLGATIGRSFSYDLLRAVSSLDDTILQHALAQLVEAELVYQQGVCPHTTYLFKHALIQEAAYQSLLRSTRQQVHQRIAHVLETQFPEIVETQPELVAHHYTEAGRSEQAVGYWLRAGQHATERSAHVEAISHLSKGLEVLKTLPKTPERAQHELTLQLALGVPLMVTKGHAAPEAEHAYARARALCQQVGETPQLFRVLVGLWRFYLVRGALRTARELAEQLLTLTARVHDPLGVTCFYLGELTEARSHLEQAMARYALQKRRSDASRAVQDPGVAGLSYLAWTLWVLGYPDQALTRSQEALTLAQELAHPFSLAFALHFAAIFHQLRGEAHVTQQRAEGVIALSGEQGFPFFWSMGMILRGWALATQGQVAEGITQMHQGLTAHRATGAELNRPHHLAMLVEAYARGGQAEEGLRVLAEALAAAHETENRVYEAELSRVKGELLLVLSTEHEMKADACFRQALEIARRQQAKSWELRAALSFSRLWQRQGKRDAARQLLAEICSWFTEGFDTADLQEAKALLEALTS
jgi:class 3 adenylate cyclase/predicted ATPase